MKDALRSLFPKVRQKVATVLGQRPDMDVDEPQKYAPKSDANLSGTRLGT